MQRALQSPAVGRLLAVGRLATRCHVQLNFRTVQQPLAAGVARFSDTTKVGLPLSATAVGRWTLATAEFEGLNLRMPTVAAAAAMWERLPPPPPLLPAACRSLESSFTAPLQ